MKNIEVELRGPLDEKSSLILHAYLEKNAKLVKKQKRLFFDLSQTIGINNRTLDVRVKVTNGEVQIVVKSGEPGGTSRREAELDVDEDSLEHALHVLALLGYPKGVYGDRGIERYMVGEIEFAVQEVIHVGDGKLHSKFYEAEILTHAENQIEAEEKLHALLSSIGLSVFSREAWNTYEATINKEANGWFEFGLTDISQFKTT
ncbi:MAG: hypothetical protein KBD27_01445 [Candidatus Moranbacteria bacterium]|nr:hypothetical protein [Candidatus Moranbacteria bacterium]